MWNSITRMMPRLMVIQKPRYSSGVKISGVSTLITSSCFDRRIPDSPPPQQPMNTWWGGGGEGKKWIINNSHNRMFFNKSNVMQRKTTRVQYETQDKYFWTWNFYFWSQKKNFHPLFNFNSMTFHLLRIRNQRFKDICQSFQI